MFVAALGVSAGAASSASAEVAVRGHVSIETPDASFRASLSPHGRWVSEPRLGPVFVPHDRDYVPYVRDHRTGPRADRSWVTVTERHGRWVPTRHGWGWIADERARRAEDAERRAEDAERRREDAMRRAGYDDPWSEQARREAQARRRAQQQERRYQQMMRRGGPGADPAADRRDHERYLRDLERDRRAARAARRDGFTM
jgi:hypothetical protein